MLKEVGGGKEVGERDYFDKEDLREEKSIMYV
jgi:hypothetical protein